MTITQIIQTLTSPLAVLIATAILGYLIRPWLLAHAQQIDQATTAIGDQRLRAAAQSIVRALESNPDTAPLPGLTQRSQGISALAAQFGISLGAAAPVIDAAYNELTATGGISIAPPPPTTAPLAVPSLADLAAAVLAQIRPTVPPEGLGTASTTPTPLSPLLAPSGAPLTAGPAFPEPLPPPGPESPAFP